MRLIVVFTALVVGGALLASALTGAAPAQPGALVWAVGDGDGSANAASLVRRIEGTRPQRFLYLGDVYPNGRARDFARAYAPTYGRLAGVTAPTPGNHDWRLARSGYFPYWRGVNGAPQPSYYSSRSGGWQILSLNSETSHGAGSRQLRWLRAQLRGRGTCRLGFWHRPRFSAGAVHGDQPDVAPFWRALRGHARIVVNGHDHDSQRLRPVDGITEFVAGAGGHGRYPFHRSYRRMAFGDATHYAALRLRLRPGLARYAFVTAGGRTLDSGQLRCRTSGSV
jgi:calcineurin-like phosphoesterase family protein